MTFPANRTVAWHAYTGSTDDDDLGNEQGTWDEDGEDRAVIGWQPTKVTETHADGSVNYAGRSVTLMDLQVPPGFSYDLRDRVTLPDGRAFEIDGAVNNDGAFHGWHPYDVLRLKLTEG